MCHWIWTCLHHVQQAPTPSMNYGNSLLLPLLMFQLHQQSSRWNQVPHQWFPNAAHQSNGHVVKLPPSQRISPTHHHQHSLARHHQFLPPRHRPRSQISARVRQVLRVKTRQKYMDFLSRCPKSSPERKQNHRMTSTVHGNSRYPCHGPSSVTPLPRIWVARLPPLKLTLSHGGKRQWVLELMLETSLGMDRWFLASASYSQTPFLMSISSWTDLGHLGYIRWVLLCCVICFYIFTCE